MNMHGNVPMQIYDRNGGEGGTGIREEETEGREPHSQLWMEHFFGSETVFRE